MKSQGVGLKKSSRIPIGGQLFKDPVPVMDGHMEVPEGPGLGLEINEEMLIRAFRPEETLPGVVRQASGV